MTPRRPGTWDLLVIVAIVVVFLIVAVGVFGLLVMR